MRHLKTKEIGRIVSWQWPSVRMSEHIVTNFLRMVRITWESRLFMSGGLCSNRISISVINFITLMLD